MVAVTVNRPLRENHVGFFGYEDPREGLVMWDVDNRAGVYLAGKSGPGFQRN